MSLGGYQLNPIFLDMDGVLVNWSGGLCKLLGIDPLHPEAQRILKGTGKAEGWAFGPEEEVDKAILKAGYDFWFELELMPWAHDLFEMCQKHGEVIFLTAPGKFHVGAHAKLDYVKKHFGKTRTVLTKHKEFCAAPGRVLVDDFGKNIDSWVSYGGSGFLWENQWVLKEDPKRVTEEMKRLDQFITLHKI